MNSNDEAKMNRTLGIDAAAFAAWQAKQTAATALAATNGWAAIDTEISRKSGFDEAREKTYQAWLVRERLAGRGIGMRTMLSEGSATLSPQPLPR